MNCIEQALKAYDKDYVDEIIRDYEEHFQDALAQGKSEEEICDSLGNPEDVIQEIQELLGEPSNGDHEVARPFTEVEQVPFQKFQQEWESSQEFEQQTFHKIRFQAGATDIKIIPSLDGHFHIYTEDPSDLKYLEYKIQENTYYGRVCNRRDGNIPRINMLRGFFRKTGRTGDSGNPTRNRRTLRGSSQWRYLCRTNFGNSHEPFFLFR